MGYKLLGYVAWQGGKWYLRRRLGPARTKLVLAGVGTAVVAGALVAARQSSSDSP